LPEPKLPDPDPDPERTPPGPLNPPPLPDPDDPFPDVLDPGAKRGQTTFSPKHSDLVGQAFSLRGLPESGGLLAPLRQPFDTTEERTYAGGMEVRLSPDQQARLQEIATRASKSAEQIVEEAVDRMLEHLEHDERFIAVIEEGRSSARRGELLEHDEVVERIDKLLF